MIVLLLKIGRYETAIGYTSWSISLADFNRDNHLDIVVANVFDDCIGVLLGYGNGTFEQQTKYETGSGSYPYYVIVTDSNNDNISDIVATNLGSNEVLIFYGYGNGSFELARNYSTGFTSAPFGIAAADLDNDTHLEYVVVLIGSGDIAILTEYNAAEFSNKTVYSTGSAPQPSSVAIGDFNNDNQSDIVVANSGWDSLGILLGSSNGTFGMKMNYSIGTEFYPQYVTTYDINKDNQIDIISVNSKNGSISVIMGYGNGSFAEQQIYSIGDKSYPSSVVAGDVNNDNRLDLVVANKGTNSIGILLGYDYTSFRRQQAFSNNIGGMAITLGDFNNDNILDIATTFQSIDKWCIYFGHGNGSFTSGKIYALPNGSLPWGIRVADFNSDNQSDIVIANELTNSIGIYLGYGNGSFSNITLYSTGNGSDPRDSAFADFNNDSRLDIVVVNYRTHDVSVFLGYGNGSFATMTKYSTKPAIFPPSVAVGDFNNDDRMDIAVAGYPDKVGILLGYGNGTFQNSTTFSSGYNSNPLWITVHDFNRDNQPDIATANYNTNNVGILLGYGNGSFASVITYSAGYGSEPQCICVGDFNNDNISDIAVANFGTSNIVVLFGLGDGSFLLGTPYSTGIGTSPFALVNGDLNKDGRLDIAVTSIGSNTVEIFLGDDNQPFASVTEYPIGDGSQPHSVALGHFNNDSWIDIVVANYGTGTIGILLGRPHSKL